MQTEVTGRICASCNQCAICWEEDTMPMYQILYRFLQALQRGRETDVQERATELGEYCPYREDLIEQVQLVFEKAHLNMAWYNRLQENRDVIAQQLDAMAYIMEDCANEETDVTAEGRQNYSIHALCLEGVGSAGGATEDPGEQSWKMAGAVSGKNQGQQVYICPGNGQTNQWCQRARICTGERQ